MHRSRINTWRIIGVCGVVAALGSLPARAADFDKLQREHGQSSSSTKHDSKDAKFVSEALEGNQSEVALAEVAARKANSQDLKAFAQHLQKDHTDANQQLQPIALTLGVQANADLKSKHEKEMAKLEKLSGQEFDREFAKMSLKDHAEDIAKYQRASAHVQNAELKQYVTQTLPKLQKHLQHAVQVATAVGVDQATIAKAQRESLGSTGGSEDIERTTSSSETSTNDVPKTSKGAGAKELKQGTP